MLYRTARPRKDRTFNITVLRFLWKLQSYLIGVFYIPNLGDVVPVLDAPAPLPKPFFYPLDERILNEAYEMVCIDGCGACCEVRSGAFAFREELEELAHEYGFNIKFSRCEKMRLVTGEVVEICEVSKGTCPFYDESSRKCLVYRLRPIICRIHYCTLVARRKGKLYIKSGVQGGKVHYIEWRGSESELAKIVRKAILFLAKRIQ